MAEENSKSYYAIIPANIRYDTNICANAKLLYGEITALCNDKGFCWASNQYFADLYNCSKKSISTWIKQLSDNRYIIIETIYKEGSKEIFHRYIRIFPYPMEENFHTPMEEKVKDNNTNINNTINNIYNMDNPKNPQFIKPTIEQVKSYCQERKNNVDAEKFIDYYTSNGWKVGKNPMKDWKASVRTWEKNIGKDKPNGTDKRPTRTYDKKYGEVL